MTVYRKCPHCRGKREEWVEDPTQTMQIRRRCRVCEGDVVIHANVAAAYRLGGVQGVLDYQSRKSRMPFVSDR